MLDVLPIGAAAEFLQLIGRSFQFAAVQIDPDLHHFLQQQTLEISLNVDTQVVEHPVGKLVSQLADGCGQWVDQSHGSTNIVKPLVASLDVLLSVVEGYQGCDRDAFSEGNVLQDDLAISLAGDGQNEQSLRQSETVFQLCDTLGSIGCFRKVWVVVGGYGGEKL